MTESFTNWYQMGTLVDLKLDENLTVVQTIPGLTDLHGNLKSELPVIAQLNEKLGTDYTGITIIKNKRREELIEFILYLSRKITAAAHIMERDDLEKKAHRGSSSLQTCGDVKLINEGRIIFGLAQENAQDLLPYGVEHIDAEKLSKMLADYEKISLQPISSRTERRNANIRMREAFKKFKSTMKSIDVVVETARDSNPDFYLDYRGARRVTGPRNSNVNLAGKIVDSSTGRPVNNAKVTLVPADPQMKSIEMMVNHHSSFRMKNLDSGAYVLRAHKPGYRDFECQVTVISNEKTSLEIKLEKL